jgi:hypothetical protein
MRLREPREFCRREFFTESDIKLNISRLAGKAGLSIVFGKADNTSMSQRIKSNKAKRGRGFTYLWILALAVLVFLLIYFEQTSLLYVLATLGVTVLLVVVAIADLGQSERSSEAAVQMSDPSSPTSGPKARK